MGMMVPQVEPQLKKRQEIPAAFRFSQSNVWYEY